MLRHHMIAAAAVLTLAAAPVQAQYRELEQWPAAEPDIVSGMLWRTTIMVSDMERSLTLYRDVLGMAPVYRPQDQADARLIPFTGLKPGQKLRLLVLRTETAGNEALNVGYLGLTQILEADGSLAKLPKLPSTNPSYGQTGIVFMVEDVVGVYEKAKAAGFNIIVAPEKRADGSNTQLAIHGPDGERLWITERKKIPTYLSKPAQMGDMPATVPSNMR